MLRLHINIPGDHSVGIWDVSGTIVIDDGIPRDERDISDLKQCLADYYDCPPGCFMTDDEWTAEIERRKNE